MGAGGLILDHTSNNQQGILVSLIYSSCQQDAELSAVLGNTSCAGYAHSCCVTTHLALVARHACGGFFTEWSVGGHQAVVEFGGMLEELRARESRAERKCATVPNWKRGDGLN